MVPYQLAGLYRVSGSRGSRNRGTIATPSQLTDKVPKLLGARFAIRNGAIVTVRKTGARLMLFWRQTSSTSILVRLGDASVLIFLKKIGFVPRKSVLLVSSGRVKP